MKNSNLSLYKAHKKSLLEIYAKFKAADSSHPCLDLVKKDILDMNKLIESCEISNSSIIYIDFKRKRRVS